MHEIVCLMMRGADTVSQSPRTQYTSAGGHDLRALGPGAGMKHLSRPAGGDVESADWVALAVRVRIAARGHHYTERRARVPSDLRPLQATLQCCLAQVDEIALQPHQNRLCFRIAESAVEFQYVGRAVRRNHRPPQEETKVGVAVLSEAFQGRFNHLAHDAPVQLRGD